MFECTFYTYAYFAICFNALRKEPDFVVYQEQVYDACKGCSFQQKPVNSYPCDAYRVVSSLDNRGHLVPNADFGKCTRITDDLIPQTIPFNRGTWGVLENRLRKTYFGLGILKGCYYENGKGRGINLILKGCYWVVLADTQIQEVGYMDNFIYEIYPALAVSVARGLETDMIRNYTEWDILNPEPIIDEPVPDTETNNEHWIVFLASLALLIILVLFLIWVNRQSCF